MDRFFSTYRVVVFSMLTLAGCGSVPSIIEVESLATKKQHIINGERIDADLFPATGALIATADNHNGTYNVYLCTATLIAPDTVLTAAHCVNHQGLVSYSFSLEADVRDAHGQTWPPPDSFGVSHVVVHRQYTNRGHAGLGNGHDVALAYLRDPIFDVEPAVMLRPEQAGLIHQGQPVEIVGYGVRKAEVVAQPTASGEKYYARSVVGEVGRYELQIGNWLPTPQKCHGDSGGPTYVQTDRGLALIGITSRAYDTRGCERGGVDTRVDAAFPWIDAQMRRGCQLGVRSECYPLP